jgi:hypothetical protein
MSEGTPKSPAYKPRPGDVDSPDAIIKAMYETLSGPAGDRNWQRLRSLFMEGAPLIPIAKPLQGGGEFKALSVDEWITDARDYLAENPFYEQEIMRKTFRFGDMLAAFSTYEARHEPDQTPIARGINSIQLLHHERRWWVVSLMWDIESKELPLPEEFLPYLW